MKPVRIGSRQTSQRRRARGSDLRPPAYRQQQQQEQCDRKCLEHGGSSAKSNGLDLQAERRPVEQRIDQQRTANCAAIAATQADMTPSRGASSTIRPTVTSPARMAPYTRIR